MEREHEVRKFLKSFGVVTMMDRIHPLELAHPRRILNAVRAVRMQTSAS